MGLVYLWLANGYLKTGRDLRRMKSNSRSLIFHDFGEMLEGLVSVRAFSAQHRFLNDVHVKIDITSKVRSDPWTRPAAAHHFNIDRRCGICPGWPTGGYC